MSTDQVDRAIAAIDAVLTDDQIDDLVDWQLSRYDQRSGYDHDVNQPAPCGHCGREEHGLAITERIESMRWQGHYDEDYRYDEDTTPVLCPGTYVPGPVGFSRAHESYRRSQGARFWFDHDDARRYHTVGTTLRERWNSFRTGRWETIRVGAPYWTFTVDEPGSWEIIPSPPAPQSSGALTVHLIDPDGRPIPLGQVRARNLQPTDTGFTFELDLPPHGLRAAVRDRGPGGRIILEGPGGQRERISGTVTAIALNDDGTRFEIDVASEHHHLPSVYTEPEETR